MHLTRRALIKWTILTCVCGGYSFFWGFMVTNGAITAMLLGMATLVLMFAAIESHPRYQARRAGNAALAKALDWGIRIRWIYAVACPLFVITGISKLLVLISSADMYIGIAATEISRTITGVSLNGESSRALAHTVDFQFTVYLTTLITGLLHTLILALICAVIYGVLKLRIRCCKA